jgi:hypothetical protein
MLLKIISCSALVPTIKATTVTQTPKIAACLNVESKSKRPLIEIGNLDGSGLMVIELLPYANITVLLLARTDGMPADGIPGVGHGLVTATVCTHNKLKNCMHRFLYIA